MKKILVLGGNFGGVTSALEAKRSLKNQVHVKVISRSPDFVYIPSLIWVPFGRRKLSDITFPVKNTLAAHGIEFEVDEAVRVDPTQNQVQLASGKSKSGSFHTVCLA